MFKIKTVIVYPQEENWEDGPDHDAFLVTVSDEDFKIVQDENTVKDKEFVDQLIDNLPPKTFPVTIDGIFKVWWSY